MVSLRYIRLSFSRGFHYLKDASQRGRNKKNMATVCESYWLPYNALSFLYVRSFHFVSISDMQAGVTCTNFSNYTA